VRRGLLQLIEDQPDFRVVGAVSSGEEALSVAEREPVDVAVVDYQLKGRNGLWVSRKLKRRPDPPRVIIYTAYGDGLLAVAAVVAEADAVVSKGALGSELCDAIRSVAAGRSVLPVVSWPLGEVLRRQFDNEQQAIYGMLAARIAPAEIARTLRIPESGLESRLGDMLDKLETMDAAPKGPGNSRRR
jgi:DNA-binding NarL/FixJ family response regulator